MELKINQFGNDENMFIERTDKSQFECYLLFFFFSPKIITLPNILQQNFIYFSEKEYFYEHDLTRKCVYELFVCNIAIVSLVEIYILRNLIQLAY